MPWRIAFCSMAFVGLILFSCVDEKAVNVAFYQSGLSWYVFSEQSPNGLKVVKSFDELRAHKWVPRSRALFASDLIRSMQLKTAAATVSSKGLVLLDDSTGQLSASIPGTSLDWTGYQTGQAFVADRKLFFQIFQSGRPIKTPSVALGWWAQREPRAVFLPIPSQVKNSEQQAISVDFAEIGKNPPVLGILWRTETNSEIAYRKSSFNLVTSEESELTEAVFETPSDLFREVPTELKSVCEALAGKIKATVRTIELRKADEPVLRQVWFEKGDATASAYTGVATNLLLSPDGLLAIQNTNEPTARIYRLPDLGAPGRYTAVLELEHGVLMSWQLNWRGYVGPAGLVYVPFPVFSH